MRLVTLFGFLEKTTTLELGWTTSLQSMASLHFVLALSSQIVLFIRNIDSQQVLAIGMLFYMVKAMSEIYGRIGLSLCIDIHKIVISSLNINANGKTTMQEVTGPYYVTPEGFKVHKI